VLALRIDRWTGSAREPMDIGLFFREYRLLMAYRKIRFGAGLHDRGRDAPARTAPPAPAQGVADGVPGQAGRDAPR
jgi:hypothetical protein